MPIGFRRLALTVVEGGDAAALAAQSENLSLLGISSTMQLIHFDSPKVQSEGRLNPTVVRVLIAAVVAGHLLNNREGVSEELVLAHGKLIEDIKIKYPEVDIDILEHKPHSAMRQESAAEDLEDVGANEDVELRSSAENVLRLVSEFKLPATSISMSSVHLERIEAEGLTVTVAGDGSFYRDEATDIMPELETSSEPQQEKIEKGPVRGFPGMTVSSASPQTAAGSDFSIFVLVQNPFDVPITVHQVQTHIPVELLDVNRLRLHADEIRIRANEESTQTKRGRFAPVVAYFGRRHLRNQHFGVATAVGPELGPEQSKRLFQNNISVQGGLSIPGTAKFAAVEISLPPGFSSNDLDGVMRRVVNYTNGVIPVTLQPGDSIVRQFVLRTRSRVLFRPLTHTFQIQVNYSVDGVDHTGTIPYQLSIQAAIDSVAWGSALGAGLGTIVKTLGNPSVNVQLWPFASAMTVSVIAAIAIVIAFTRKSSAQPLVSIEDFWGGLVIGFGIGYFGFDSFMRIIPGKA